MFILEVEKQRDGFAVVLGRRGWDFLTREESLSDVSLLVSVVLELCSESVWVATLNRRVCDLQLTGRFKCDRKVLTPKPERQSRVKLIHIRRVALPLLKCGAGRMFPFSYGQQILLSSYLYSPEFQNHHNVSVGL